MMLHLLWLLACSSADPTPAVGASPSAEATTEQAPAGTPGLVMREHPITDPGMNNAVASTILVPEGWKVEGGITRTPPALYRNPVLPDVKVEAPDGRAVHFFPSLNFEFGQNIQGPLLQPTMGGNLHFPLPESLGAWVRQMAQMSPAPGVTGLSIVREEDVPELTQQLRQAKAARFSQVQQMNQTGASIGVTQGYDAQATRVVLSYQLDGKPMEETLVATWEVHLNMLHGQVTGGYWAILAMQSMRGPAGTDYVDDPALNAILGSVRVNPAWAAEMQRFWQELARIEHKGAMDRAAQNARHQQVMAGHASDISDIIHQGWRSRSAASDRMQAATVDAIHEQTPYVTPSGNTVQLPSFYNHVYTDGDGRYLLHNDALHDPNTDPAFRDRTWQRVQPAR